MSVITTIRLTEPLAQALHKSAHKKEMSKTEFVVHALIEAMGYLGSDEIDQLVTEHKELQPKPRGPAVGATWAQQKRRGHDDNA